MTSQQLVDPARIEPELLRIWDSLSKEKMRACLFNLIVFNRLSSRTDYIREIVQKVSEKYPCRVLFITSDEGHSYLKTAVSVVGSCDYIDIGVSGSEMAAVPFLLLPHIIPDLPVSLLWTEDPCASHTLFQPLIKLATRVIFDSESADSLPKFSEEVLSLSKKIDTADLNWARIEGWRELIASLFHSEEDKIEKIEVVYNCIETEFFCHLKVQTLYLLAWLKSRLHTSFKVSIKTDKWKELGPGTLISVDISTEKKRTYHCVRDAKQPHSVTIHTASPLQCELPYQFLIGKIASGQSLIKEIINKGTSTHYLEMLKKL
jgi:hypothetical protein